MAVASFRPPVSVPAASGRLGSPVPARRHGRVVGLRDRLGAPVHLPGTVPAASVLSAAGRHCAAGRHAGRLCGRLALCGRPARCGRPGKLANKAGRRCNPGSASTAAISAATAHGLVVTSRQP